MTAHFSGRQFGRAAAWRIGLFLGVVFGLPLGLCFVDRLNGSNVSFTEAIALMTQSPIGVSLYLLLLLSLIRPSWRRMRALGLPGWSGIVVPLLLFADVPYLIVKPGSSVFGTSVGSLGGNIPLYITMALGLIAAMTFLREPTEGQRPFGRFGLAGKGALLMLAFVIFFLAELVVTAKLLRYFQPRLEEGDPSIGWFLSFLINSYWLFVIHPYACLTFVALLAWVVVTSRRQAGLTR
ncbi:hypothetical protein [Afipia clevelandensis]|nr:hypothetical protein [Afipia clevelandensis]